MITLYYLIGAVVFLIAIAVSYTIGERKGFKTAKKAFLEENKKFKIRRSHPKTVIFQQNHQVHPVDLELLGKEHLINNTKRRLLMDDQLLNAISIEEQEIHGMITFIAEMRVEMPEE